MANASIFGCWVVVIGLLGGCGSANEATAPEQTESVISEVSTATRIDCGGSAIAPYTADANFSGGSTINHAVAINTSRVTSPAPQALYQTARVGNFTYQLTGFAPGSAATLRLHFAETYWSAAGSRLFNVTINSATVLKNFDVFKAAGGRNIAVIEPFAVAASSSGAYVIQFSSVKDNSLVSGIEILTNGSCSTNADCGGATCPSGSSTYTTAGTCSNGTCKSGASQSCAPFKCNGSTNTCATSCTTNADCGGATCPSGSSTYTTAGTCTNGACSSGTSQSCAPFKCNGSTNTCATSCTTNADCGSATCPSGSSTYTTAGTCTNGACSSGTLQSCAPFKCNAATNACATM